MVIYHLLSITTNISQLLILGVNPYNNSAIEDLFMPKTFSDQVRDYVRKSDLSLYRLALEAKVDNQVVRRFMDGGAITTPKLDAIAEVLGLKVTDKPSNKKR